MEADATGHLENIPAPRTPGLLLVGLLVLLLGATVIQLGWVPPRDANGGDATASQAPGGSAPPAGSPAPGESAPPPSGGPVATVVLTARNVAFDTDSISGPAAIPFTIGLVNDDAGIPHNVELLGPDGGVAFKGEIFNGVDTRVYDVGPLPPGEYTFICSVHPNMKGTATIQ